MRRAIRIAVWSLGGLLLAALLLIAAVVVIGNTAGGRRLLEHETAQLTSGRVRIAGLSGAFPSSIDIATFQMSDSSGVWMTAERVSLRWSPLALLAWDLHVERFDIGRVEVARRPVSTTSSTGRGSGSTRLPAVDIDRLDIGTLELEPAAAGTMARLSVHGNLHYRSLENVRTSLVARRTNGTGDYELNLGLARSRMIASLELEEPAGGPLEHLVNLPGLGALSVTARLDGPPNMEKLRLSAHAGQLHVDAGGTIDLERHAADLTYSLTAPAMEPRPGLSWQRVALQGRWQGPETAPHATGVLDLEGLELPDGARLDTLDANLLADGGLLTLEATADGITLAGSQPQLLQSSPLTLHAALSLDRRDRPLQLTVTHRLLSLKVNAVTAGTRSATFDLRLPDLARLAALYHEHIRGSMSLSGTVAESGLATRLDVSGTGDLAGSSVVARLLGADTRLQLKATVNTKSVDIEHLEVNGRALSVSAAGSAERSAPGASGGAVRALRAKWQVSLPNLALISPSAAGSVEVSGTANGPLRSLAADVRARSKLSIRGSPPGTVEAIVRTRGLPSALNAVFRADGIFAGAPVRLNGSLEQVAGHAYHIVVQQGTWKSLYISGDLTAGANLAAGRGSLRLGVGRLADLQPLVGTSLQGSIAGSATLSPGPRQTRAQFDLIARNVVAGGVSGNARLSAAGPVDALRVQLMAQSPNFRGAPVSVAAAARLNETGRALDLDRFLARYRGQTVRLVSPSQVLFAGGLKVRNLRLGAQKAVIAVDGEISPALNLRASIHHVDAALVDAFVPHLLAQGTLNADAHLSGTRSAPVGQASLRITGLKLATAAAQGLPAIDARGSARFRASVADVSAQLDAGPASRVRLSGRAPLDTTGAVALRLTGKMDAALMNSILEARGERAAGTLTMNATVAGSAHAPQIRGAVQLTNGDLRDYAEGIHVGDINARLVGDQGVLKIASMTARAGPGQLTAKGTVGVLQPGMPIHVSLSAHDIQPITNDILTANLDTDIKVEGTLRQRIDVSGTIHVNRASISIPNGFPPNVATLEVIRPGEAPAPASVRRLVIGLGITMDAPDAIFVQGRGLDAQLGGKLHVAGTSDNPQVSGGFRMVRGAFSLAGTNLKFRSGKVSFNGEGLKGRIDPTLDFVAQTSVTYNGPTTVTLRVTGFADSPKISLSSSPPLPQDDLLGLLLFGKPASQLTALQLAQTGAALASLSGIGGGGGGSKWNPLTWIKKGLGLNTLSVGGAAPRGGAASGGGTKPTGASVTAGKYISNRVYLAAKQTTNGTSQVQVDVDLSQRLKLQTRIGNGTATAQGTTPENDPGSSIGLIYQWQY